MIKVQPKIGFHTGGGGGNLTGITSDYIIPVLAAGKNVTIVAADTTAGLYDAAVAVKNYQNTKSVLCWRRSDQRPAGGFDFDALANNFTVSPEENAAAHYAAYVSHFPLELEPYGDVVEYIVLNEIRGKQTSEPMYQGLHIGEYLGRFALHYRTLTTKRLLFFGFASGEPEPDVWEQPSMLDFLRLCGERPYDTGIALHEYSYAVDDILHGYPYKVGRFDFLLDICEAHSIPWPRIVISEFGWTLSNVPDPAKAIADIAKVMTINEADDDLYGYGYYPNVVGAAIWWLGPGFGGVADKAQKLIKPLGDYIVATDYELELEQQQPPDGGGGTMTQINHNLNGTIGKIAAQNGGTVGPKMLKLRQRKWDSRGWFVDVEVTDIELDPECTNINWDVTFTETVEDTENPNPPPVELTLPQGSKGVDLSAYQKGFFSKVSPDKFDFFMFRCSDGMNTSATSKYHDANGIDTALFEFADVGHASGKPWGVYHFLRPANVEAQISKVRMIHQMLVDRGTPPRVGKFADGVIFAGIWADVEDYSLTNEHVKQFIAGVGIVSTTGIYTGKYVWEAVTSGVAVWWSNKPLWLAAYGANNGQIPPWSAPSIPRGWTAVNIWQYTSEGQLVITEWTGDGLDLNSAGPYVPAVKPPDPPTGATYDTSFMRGEPGIWRVIRRGDGSGEDTWESKIDAQNDVRVKNTNEGEWYFYGLGGVWRKRDTSPAPDPTNGKQRYYVFTEGGQIAPNQAQVGVTYYYPNYVQFREKNIAAGCPNLPANSGPSTSTFLLKEVIKDYVFPGTGFKVDWLYVTVQTGENQLYAIHQGRVLGWVGGGATQANNVWAGELAEVYYDRAIPAQRPLEYC